MADPDDYMIARSSAMSWIGTHREGEVNGADFCGLEREEGGGGEREEGSTPCSLCWGLE